MADGNDLLLIRRPRKLRDWGRVANALSDLDKDVRATDAVDVHFIGLRTKGHEGARRRDLQSQDLVRVGDLAHRGRLVAVPEVDGRALTAGD